MMFSGWGGGEGVRGKVAHDVLSLYKHQKEKKILHLDLTYYQASKTCSYVCTVSCVLYNQEHAASTERLEQICTHSSTECIALLWLIETVNYLLLLLLCEWIVLQEICFYRTIIQTRITSKKISCYMLDSTCRWFIFKKAKATVSWSLLFFTWFFWCTMQ